MKRRPVIRLIDVDKLIAGIIPVILASVYSLYRFTKVSWFDMVLLIIALLLIQTCSNMIFDYHMLKRSENKSKMYDKSLGQIDDNEGKCVFKWICLVLAIDLVIGIYYSIRTDYRVLIVALIGIAVMYVYSGGKKPISHTPFSEFIIGSTMGFGIMTTVIYIQSGVFNLETTIVALPMAIYIGTILLTNNIADHAGDIIVGKKTLAISLGIKWSEVLWFISCHSLLTFTAAFVFVGFYPFASLIVVLVLFPYESLYRFRKLPKNFEHKREMMNLIGHIGIRYNVAIIIGLLITMLFGQVVV